MCLENDQLARRYSMKTLERKEDVFLGGGTMTTVDGTDVARPYDEFYRYAVPIDKFYAHREAF